MKIQGLAVLAIILILPMTIILNSYSANEIKTVDLQMNYDSRLKVATYDGIKAFQMNMSNSSTSDFADSKMRDIKAAISTFYNSLSSQFSMTGYGADVLQAYVPAIVYTLYDGYYIYSDYKNTLGENDQFYSFASGKYEDGEDLYGLKPYIYYSCRYKNQTLDYDVVITYTLDSYITIQGKIGGKVVNESGYLLSGVEYNKAEDKVTYRGIEIEEENAKEGEENFREGLEQYVYIPGEQRDSENEGFIGKKLTYTTVDNTEATGQTRSNTKISI